jgi:predicted DCC family thiol-disulfide oxidoreductase YuxK
MRWLRGLYLDLRSVALFRIALGLCVVADILTRIPQIDEFYTDRGVMPREAIFRTLNGTWAISLHFISGQWVVQLILFFAAVVFAVGLVLGYRTRLCAIASWFLVMSVQVRSPLVLHGGDDLLRMLLFWSMFVPLNGQYALDRMLNPSAPQVPATLLSPGSLALIFQICAVYWYTAAEKMHPIWLTERSAVYYALSLDQFATSFGKFLLQFPELLRLLSSSTLILEMFGPLLVVSPIWTARLRLLAVTLFLSFHAGIGLSLHLGLFPWVCAAAWLVFLPGEFWDFLTAKVRRRGVGTVVFFDGNCGFCRNATMILRHALLLEGVVFEEAQSDHAIHARMREGNSWIVRDSDGTLHFGYDAFVTLTRLSPIGRWFAWVVGSSAPRAIGERVYRWISADRNRAARLLARITPPPPRERFGVASNVLALIALVLVEAVLARRPTIKVEAVEETERLLITLVQLGQSWRMFAPYPTLDDGWYVMEGITRDGRRVDIWMGEDHPDYDKPADVWATYKDSQWQKYLTNMWQRGRRQDRDDFGRYLCRTWNERHSGQAQIDLVYVNYMVEWTPEPGKPAAPATKQSVFQYNCTGQAASAAANSQ